MNSTSKKTLRAKALRELKSIRRSLQEDVTTRKIDRVLAGAEEVTVQRTRENRNTGKAVVLKGLDELRAAVLATISSKKDMYQAMGYWSAVFLLEFTMEQRSVICHALLEKARDLGVRPKSTWVAILKNPQFFEEWSHEVFDAVEDDTSSLDEVAL